MSSEPPDIGTKATDWAVSVTKGGLGAVPLVGSLLAEVVGSLIPNQRMDRLARYFTKLDERLRIVEQETLNARLEQPEIVDILEDSFHQAARAVSDERLDHIANVVATGISAEQLSAAEAKRMLWLLGQLNDIEVILLRARLAMTNEDLKKDEEFRERHPEILARRSPVLGSSDKEIEEAAIYASYLQHLFDLGLLRPRFRSVRKGELPEFDDKTGMLKASGSEITRLGRMLLQYLNLVPDYLSH